MILILIFAINLIECIKVTDFCYKTEINGKVQECQFDYRFSIGDTVCAKDRYSSQSLRTFNGIRNTQRNENDYIYLKTKFETFMSQIKDCPKPPLYKWKPKDVCLTDKNCFKAHGLGIWSILMQPDLCKCREKYSYRCNTKYCTLNKQACDGLYRQKSSSKYEIKKCNTLNKKLTLI
jgi:hypothetical protein